MTDDEDAGVITELSRRIALFEKGEALGDCMGSGERLYCQLGFWLAAGIIAWCALALAAR